MKALLPSIVLLASTACTPGSFAAVAPIDGTLGPQGRTVTVDVNLTSDPGGSTSAGIAAGYAPLVTEIAVGDGVRLRNSDGFAHTASSIAGSTFPNAYPFDGTALRAGGSKLSSGFSSGSLAPGTTSQPLLADRAGTFIYGCFYHYGSPMRAAIVVR